MSLNLFDYREGRAVALIRCALPPLVILVAVLIALLLLAPEPGSGATAAGCASGGG